ncbi:MAG: hypothetical protein ACPL3P_08190 [Anaerolineales bacterium]
MGRVGECSSRRIETGGLGFGTLLTKYVRSYATRRVGRGHVVGGRVCLSYLCVL